jgi:hypothetical protein
MSHYLINFLALLFIGSLLILWRHTAKTKSRLRDGFYVVAWPFHLRLLSAMACIGMFTACAVLVWASLQPGEKVPFELWALVIVAGGLFGYATLFVWRNRNEYNQITIVSYSMFGRPKQFMFSDFTRAGPVGARGLEFETEAGDKIYVNLYQTGGVALIELLQRQVKETYFE